MSGSPESSDLYLNPGRYIDEIPGARADCWQEPRCDVCGTAWEATAEGYEPVGLLVNGHEFIPEDVYQRHLPFAVPAGVKVQRLYVEADRG